MRKSFAAMLVLLFITASCTVAVEPALSSEAMTENSWVSKASMLQARSGLGVAVVNGKIYAIGGYAENGVVGTNEEYDPETNTWTYKKPMPTPRDVFAIASYQNKIYCVGGYASDGSITEVSEVYDPATDIWETKSAIPTPRRGLKANVANGKIYFIGGAVPDNSSSTGVSILSLNEVYDPANDSWTTKAAVPTGVSGRFSAVVDGKIYVLMPNPNLNQVYDAGTDSWSLEGAPLPHFSMVYVSVGATTGVNALKRIYLVGDGGTLVYDPVNDSWRDGAAMPTDREGFGMAVVNDVLYAIGGYNSSYQNYPDDWIYGPSVTVRSTNERYTPFGYGTADPSYDGTAPEITVVSPENKTYCEMDVALNFTVNESASSMGYELDREDFVEISGNVTLTGLPYGSHNLTVYATDAADNTGVSETINFSIAKEQEPFPITPVAIAILVGAVVVGVGLLIYFKKRNH